jgi:transcriptional regulator with XRE-family HTH domain
MSISEQLKQRKADLDRTLDGLSTLSGLSAPHISTVLSGSRDARASTLETLADAMDAQWVLVPKHLLSEVERLLSGKSIRPDDVPSTVDRLFGGGGG